MSTRLCTLSKVQRGFGFPQLPPCPYFTRKKAVTRRSFKPVVSIVTGAILLFFMLQYYPQGDIFLQPFCSLKPVKTYLSSCQQEPIPNFSHLIKVQESLYENVLSAQANNAEVMSTLDLKRVELAARDIQVTVKYSNLVSADLLYDKLGEYLVRSRQLGRDIQVRVTLALLHYFSPNIDWI